MKTAFQEMFPQGLPDMVPVPGTDDYILARTFVYARQDGTVLVIPKEFRTDGASIPRFCWRLVGHPFDPDYVCAAVVHDWMWRHASSWGERQAANAVFAEVLARMGTVNWVVRCMLESGVFFGNVGKTVWPWK